MNKDRLNRTLLDKNINKKIEAFRLLYELKTFSKVAQTMNCSLPTISNLISDLEYYFGAKLLERHGKNGVFITQEGENLYKKTNNWNKSLTNVFNKITDNIITNNSDISVFMHPLFSNYYFNNFFSSLCPAKYDFLNKMHFNLYVGDKKQANEYLQKGIDVVIFPFEWGDIGCYKDEYDIFNIKPYEIFLYMHKNNKYANLKNDDFTWDILADANIMPNDREIMFKTPSALIGRSSHSFSTNVFDLYFLYQGILNNMWTVAIGNEFEKIFDCKNLVVYPHQLAPKLQFATYWMILTKKDINREDVLLKITNLFKKMFETCC